MNQYSYGFEQHLSGYKFRCCVVPVSCVCNLCLKMTCSTLIGMLLIKGSYCVQEEEARREIEKMELLTQARTSAAVTMEKARQLEGTKDLQIQVILSFMDLSFCAQMYFR